MRVRPCDYSVLLPLLVVSMILVLGQTIAQAQVQPDKTGRLPKPNDPAAVTGLTLNQEQADAIQIRMDAKGPVFVYASAGAPLIAEADVRKINPKLQVFADRKIVIGGSAGVPMMGSKFTETELTEFLDFVVNKNRFFELNTKDIVERTAGKGKTRLVDANSSVFTIELQRGKHEVEVYALWNAVRNFGDFEEIQRLAAIEKRCNAVISKIQLGDDGDKVLQLVNEKVAELGLGMAPFTLDEMRLASRLARGRFQVSFQRALPMTDKNPAAPPVLMHAIYFVMDAKSEPTVKFYGLPNKK